ncbi:MAG: CAP domain-containing protein [Planctomycetota bacterium]|nr:CAP domain-containing protein [Planctomycetota bacterium]
MSLSFPNSDLRSIVPISTGTLALSSSTTAAASPTSQLLGMINDERQRNGLDALNLDSRLSRVALAHSRDMLETDFFAHDSPSTGNLKQRLESANIDFPVAGENLGFASSLSEVNRILFESPGHRANLLNPEFTNVGLGIVNKEDGSFLVTQVFSKPSSIQSDSKVVERETVGQMNAARVANQTPPLVTDPIMLDAARANSNQVARTGQIDLDLLQSQLELRRPPSQNIHAFVFQNPSINDILKLEDLASPIFRTVGFGLSTMPNRAATLLLGTDGR